MATKSVTHNLFHVFRGFNTIITIVVRPYKAADCRCSPRGLRQEKETTMSKQRSIVERLTPAGKEEAHQVPLDVAMKWYIKQGRMGMTTLLRYQASLADDEKLDDEKLDKEPTNWAEIMNTFCDALTPANKTRPDRRVNLHL